MGTPILPTLLAWLGSRAGCPRSQTIAIHIGHGNGMAWQHGREGSVYPVAPLLGPGRRGGGGRPTEVRGQRRAAGIRKGEEGQCPSLCSGPAGAPLLPWAWPAGPRVRGGGPHVWTAAAVAPGRGRWSGSGAMAGHQGWAVPRRAGAGKGPLAPGAREDKGLGARAGAAGATVQGEGVQGVGTAGRGAQSGLGLGGGLGGAPGPVAKGHGGSAAGVRRSPQGRAFTASARPLAGL